MADLQTTTVIRKYIYIYIYTMKLTSNLPQTLSAVNLFILKYFQHVMYLILTTVNML